MLFCLRCIEMNPVRAARVTGSAKYRWSSYPHHAFGKTDPILTPYPLCLALGTDEASGTQLTGSCSLTRSKTAQSTIYEWL